MGKMKVHELAKELKLSSKEFMEKLEEMGIEVKSHMSSLEEDEVAKIKKNLGKKSSSKKNEEPKSEKAKADKPKVERIKADKPKAADNDVNKKDRKPITPVIIRREVTRVTTSEPERPTRGLDRDDLGVVQRRTDTSINIEQRLDVLHLLQQIENQSQDQFLAMN